MSEIHFGKLVEGVPENFVHDVVMMSRNFSRGIKKGKLGDVLKLCQTIKYFLKVYFNRNLINK